MKYTETVSFTKEEIDRVRLLLSVDCFEGMPTIEKEALGIKEDDCIPMFAITFDNGNTLILDIRSGNENYYDDMWMQYADGTDTVFDCEYELLDEIEVEDKYGNTYVVTIVEEEGEVEV